MLAIVGSLFATRLALLAERYSNLSITDLPFLIGLVLALAATSIVLCMPIRDPKLPQDSISRPGQAPTSDLRSPEDNLTLWQFMTVSWMSPLISLGSARQLNDEDVWSLSLEFQHKGLHENFRILRGSVVKRLLMANGLDLILISALGIVECLSSRL